MMISNTDVREGLAATPAKVAEAERGEAPGAAPPFVSVIIPVFNDGVRLAKCLKALERQTYPAERFEVIVVDNNSSEEIGPVITQFPHARLASEKTPGSYAARNTGLSVATGSIVAFTDSDCVPQPDWIEEGVRSLLRTNDCGLVAGQIDIFYEDPDHPTAVELYERVTAFPQERYVKWGFGVTANMFTSRAVFERVGLFHSGLQSGGDGEWGKRVKASGYQLAYAERARVGHPARRSFNELYQKTIRVLDGLHHIRAENRDAPADSAPRGRLRRSYNKMLFFGENIFEIMSSDRITGPASKTKAVAVFLSIKAITAGERMRLKFFA